MSARPPCPHDTPAGQLCLKCAAALLGARGGAAGRGDKKRRDPKMLSAAGKKGAAARWQAEQPPKDKP